MNDTYTKIEAKRGVDYKYMSNAEPKYSAKSVSKFKCVVGWCRYGNVCEIKQSWMCSRQVSQCPKSPLSGIRGFKIYTILKSVTDLNTFFSNLRLILSDLNQSFGDEFVKTLANLLVLCPPAFYVVVLC